MLSTSSPVALAADTGPGSAPPLADDLLRGAASIAAFLFGDPAERRQVYHLASEVKPEHRLPCFRLGSILCARRSTLIRWIGEREGRAA
jgi:hypothetical protein